MAAADTARLLASYELQDKSAAGVRSALGGVGRLESGVSGLGSKLSSFASNLKTNIGGAITHFGGRLKQLASAGLGLLGVGGIFGIGALIKSSISDVREFGGVVSKLASITGLTAEQTSALAGAFHHFGIEADQVLRIAGFTEKAVGGLTLANQKGMKALKEYNQTHEKHLSLQKQNLLLYPKAVAFQKQYGLSILSSTGQVKDFNALLLDAADFFNNKNIPAQRKAAALAKLFGRNWQELIPVLKAGRKGIGDAEAEAKRLGLTLTKDNIEALKKSKAATRDFGTALGGLKLQIGLAFIPLLTDFAQRLTGFIVSHRTDIIDFFKNVAHFIGVLVDAVSRIPSGLGITNLIQGAIDAWDKIPAPLRDLLVKGVVADRTVKFLFGISPVEVAVKFAQEAIVGLVGGVAKAVTGGVGNAVVAAGIGKAFVQPVFVTNPGFGGVGGGAVPAAAAGGGLSLLAAGAALTLTAAGELLIADQIGQALRQAVQGDTGPLRADHVIATFGPVEFGVFKSQAQAAHDTAVAGKDSADTLEKIATNTAGSPDERNSARITAHHIAALNDRHARLLANQRPEDSEKHLHHLAAVADRQERIALKNIQKQDEAKAKLEATKTAIDRDRDAVETARIAQVSAQRNAADRIVDAIDRIKLDNSVKVFVDSGDAGNRTSYESSTNIGGGGGRRAKPP